MAVKKPSFARTLQLDRAFFRLIHFTPKALRRERSAFYGEDGVAVEA